MKHWVGILALLSSLVLEAQVISGKVYDEISQSILPGATVTIVGSQQGTATDETGSYRFEKLAPGRYQLQVSYVGYSSKTINDVWVKSATLVSQDVYLERTHSDLNEVVVFAGNSLSVPGRISISEEQINRYAATYYDPARLVASSPDMAIANDQNNQISVRGLSPNYNVWRLEGAEIVNPNHLSNAGTFLDQPSATGGGVNMLSAQMLSKSEFLYSTFDNRYGNSVGGIFDMYLKEGNAERKQYTAQASLIGFDLASEGPIKKGSPITYAVNYRYSFTGLLTNFGVDFGGESIGFQDLSFNVSSPIGEKTIVKVFGVGGLSFNDFEHSSFEESEIEKDRRDIYYKNKTGVIGVNLLTLLKKGSLNTTLNLSANDNSRRQTDYNDQDAPSSENFEIGKESILSLNIAYARHLGNGALHFGTLANRYDFDKTYFSYSWHLDPQYLIRPSFSYWWIITDRLETTVGASLNTNLNYASLDPRLKVNYQLGQNHTLSIGVGQYSQLLSPYNYLYSNPYGEEVWQSKPYKFLTSVRYTLGYVFEKELSNIALEFFHYDFSKARAESTRVFVEPYNQAQAQTTGFSLSTERSFEHQFYYKAGVCLFDSKIAKRDTQFNANYNMNISSGKEWGIGGGTKDRTFSINLNVIYQGGQHLGGQAFILESANPRIEPYQTNDFFRTDLRMIWTINKRKYSSSIALDIQNLTNAQNESFRYYDNFTNQFESQYNLGLIPILTYRVEW